jgi:hypothetical protein
MNTNLRFLPLLTIAAAATVCLAPMSANAKGARFDFAPNIYKIEQSRLPSDYGAVPHSVRTGSVPHSSSFLGVDPQLLATPPVAPVAQAIPRVSGFTTAVPMNASFKNAFGSPITKPVMAVLPKTATPLSLPQSATKQVAAKLVSAKTPVGNKNLHGTLLSKPRRNVIPSTATALALSGKKIEGYGNNVGYTPGAYLPTASGSGLNIQADVSGRVLETHPGR